MNLGINYDRILNRAKYKYVIPIIAAKRAETLKNLDELKGITEKKDYVSIALKELEEGKIQVKNSALLDSLSK
ncbi:DNA-directed RNA polymerase subunit omega [Petrotoga mexicana DSM 14811]|uniref:DNA-directed RNA polymerase subunit omega n=1 Tax=Petrotoga mexicana DSM 14811 TaxID=1122954 RepID=A0A2K1PAI4_9BACT|nr:DNA-directed RNA polymerase subunit omega [Petrotoga mexicana]PNR99799.1 DNA-directed RNA polymerase subunit omega [Petrotoga mexicana DSM 14811]